jgi:hypothetical protein
VNQEAITTSVVVKNNSGAAAGSSDRPRGSVVRRRRLRVELRQLQREPVRQEVETFKPRIEVTSRSIW